MTVYTDSLSNLRNYREDYYKIAVTTFLSYPLQTKVDAWFNEVAPSRQLSEKIEKKEITWDEFAASYHIEMVTVAAQSKIKWIKDFSKNKDVVLLCHEDEADPRCHRHILKKIIEAKAMRN